LAKSSDQHIVTFRDFLVKRFRLNALTMSQKTAVAFPCFLQDLCRNLPLPLAG